MVSSHVERCERPSHCPSPAALSQAVRLVADEALGGAARPRTDKVLDAVETLSQAPPCRDWEDALLQGLKSANAEVVQRVCDTWMHRLDAFSDDAQAQDDLIDAALNACYYVLTGSADTVSAPDLFAGMREAAAAQLIRGLTAWLKSHPDRFDHHRARVLAWGNRLKYLGGLGDFANSVVEFQVQLGSGDRSDHAAARALTRERRRDAYEDPNTAQATLLGYLQEDAELTLGEISGELLGSYAVVLSLHHVMHAGQALAKALANLARWLDALPYRDGEGWDPLFSDMFERARVRLPWDQLARDGVPSSGPASSSGREGTPARPDSPGPDPLQRPRDVDPVDRDPGSAPEASARPVPHRRPTRADARLQRDGPELGGVGGLLRADPLAPDRHPRPFRYRRRIH